MLLAIDWGTSSARAYLVDGEGRIAGTRSAPLGIQKLAGSGFADALDTLLGDWKSLRAPRIAAGMIGSRQGWTEASYVECPAAFEALASHLVETPGGELSIIPGLIAREAGVPDVMRGEETQLAGAVDENGAPLLAVLPGTHCKWARIEHGRVVDFQTHMTGELYAVLLANSILGRLAEPREPESLPGPAFAQGVARGLGEGALGQLVFGARTLALTSELAGRDVPDWLSGLLIGYEVRNATAWAARRQWDASRVRVIGSDALVARYAEALRLAGIAAEHGRADAAVHGIVRIARLAGRL